MVKCCIVQVFTIPQCMHTFSLLLVSCVLCCATTHPSMVINLLNYLFLYVGETKVRRGRAGCRGVGVVSEWVGHAKESCLHFPSERLYCWTHVHMHACMQTCAHTHTHTHTHMQTSTYVRTYASQSIYICSGGVTVTYLHNLPCTCTNHEVMVDGRHKV